ncbi:MAG: carboxypeptidase regulatory-like domain-containing protein [Candidatus Acidiferrum sp.]
MKRLRLVLAVLLALALLAGAGSAADTLLVLKGRVIDENGLPVGGAQVKLELAGGQSFSAASDDAGYFSLPNLPPGEYKARIEKLGYFVLADQKIELKAESTEFTFTLNHEEEVHEKVDVTVPENRIDPATTQSSESLSGQEILDLPVPSSHNLQQSLVAMPQVLMDNSDLLHIAGARNTQVQYLLDGVEVGDPASNGLSSRMIVEAVRTAEIQTARFGAEYAHPGGAILSYETREGDDQWRFNATDFIPGINIQEGAHLGNYYPRVTFSGPIIPDGLWFSQSFDVLHTLAVQKGLPPGAPNETQQWGGDSWSRLLWKMSANNSLHVGYLANVEEDSDLGLDVLHPQTVTVNANSREQFGFVKEQSYFEKTVFEMGIGVEDSIYNATPQGTAPYVQLVNGAEGNYFQKLEDDSRRYQFFTNAIRGPLKWFGTHTISAGANFSGVELTQASTRGEIRALRADLTLDRLTTFAGSANFHVANTLAGGFLQDSWSPNAHFVVLAGVRADWDRLFQAGLVQPRLALNWMPLKDNRGKFSIGWGMYNIPLNLSVIGQAYDQQEVDTLYNAPGKVPIQGPATSAFVLPTNGLQSLQQPYFDIASAGWEQRIGENTLVSVELLARDQHHGLAWETLSPGQIGSEFLLQSSRRDKYRGATVTARHTFKNTAVLFGSYTRSKASSDQVLDPALGALYFAPQQAGPLSWDAPNRILTWGSTPTPIWGILFSYLFDYHTGFPYSAINQQQFLFGAANSYRFPDYASLTIGLEKKFTFKKRVFAARVSVINILNRQNPDVVVNNVDAPNFGMFTGGQGRAVTARLRFVGKK